MDLKAHIRTIPDWPEPGVQFRDVTTLFANGDALAHCVSELADRVRAHRADLVVGIEARGFILGGAVANTLGLGFAPIRKKGKLPWRTVEIGYELEYGQATIEMHVDAVSEGQRVAIVDDLIATGGTGLAAVDLAKRLGGAVVAFAAVIDLPELGGSEKIRAAGAPVETLIAYEGV